MAKIQVITSDDNGGANACEALWYELATAALEGGHHVTALIPKRSSGHGRVVELKHEGLQVCHRQSAPKGGGLLPISHKVWDRTVASWFLSRRLAKAVDFRILNVGTLVEAAMEPWFTLLCGSRAPYGVIVHNNPEIRDYPPRLAEKLRRVLLGAKRVYFVSNRLRANAEEQLLERIPGARVIRNPANLSSRLIEPWPAKDGCLRMAAVGRLDAFVKGQVRLLHALSTDSWRSREWKLTIFGSGPDREKIESAVQFYGLRGKVEFGGFVEDVRASVWKHHHLLVMPSMLEGMPLTLVEAMVCGRPALCSDVGGARELVQDGVNGFLAGSPFAEQIGEGLERVWNQRHDLRRMGQLAHEDAVRFLPVDPGAKLLEDIMEVISAR
jgi:L-malate glycosyltransferase